MKIFGAGLAGLLAGCQFQNAQIFEAGPSTQANHKAVLRFRTPAVGESVGIDFRKVPVTKGIWMDGKSARPSIRNANLYSQKVIGKLADRSIFNIESVERFIAPEDFLAQLVDRCASRIQWDHKIEPDEFRSFGVSEPKISTLPMNLACKFVDGMTKEMIASGAPIFESLPIKVKRWRVPGADVFQTIYFPDPQITLYRASITGDLLIAEYMDNVPRATIGGDGDGEILDAFGIKFGEPIETTKQRLGKIAPIDDDWRKQFMFGLTQHFNVYSLGRYGTWRNILLDDVLHDIAVLKKLMRTNSSYERRKAMS